MLLLTVWACVRDRFEYDGRITFVELQTQHHDILKWNDESNAHDHYDFFRARLAHRYASELDPMLERILLFFGEVRGNPVLLSMLVLIFSGGSDKLPASLSELSGA